MSFVSKDSSTTFFSLDVFFVCLSFIALARISYTKVNGGKIKHCCLAPDLGRRTFNL